MCAQAQQLQIGELEQQLEESNERLLVTEHACQEAQQQTAQLRAELENNAGLAHAVAPFQPI